MGSRSTSILTDLEKGHPADVTKEESTGRKEEESTDGEEDKSTDEEEKDESTDEESSTEGEEDHSTCGENGDSAVVGKKTPTVDELPKVTSQSPYAQFKIRQNNDHSCILGAIKSIMAGAKVHQMIRDDLWAMFQDRMEKWYINKEKKDGKTGRMLFPAHYSAEVEEQWLRRRFQKEWEHLHPDDPYPHNDGYTFKEGSRVQEKNYGAEDEDDEETLPQYGDVKREVKEEAGPQEMASDRRLPNGRMPKTVRAEEQAAEGDGDSEEQVIGIPCCRSYAIRFGCAGLVELKMKAEASSNAGAAAISEPQVMAVSRAFPTSTSNNRSWMWIDGRMVVKAPSKTEMESKDRTASTCKKRKALEM